MEELTKEERAYRRGALQSLEFILADMDTSSVSTIVQCLHNWVQCLRYGRVSRDIEFLGTYLDTVRDCVNRTKLLGSKHPLDTCASLQSLPGGHFVDLDCQVKLLYKNYKGITAWRTIVPLNKPLRWDSTSYHPEKQWLMECWDLEKQDYRTYALKDIYKILTPEEFERQAINEQGGG